MSMKVNHKGKSLEELKDPVVVFGPSKTKQSFKDEANINSIMKKFNRTGMINRVNSKTPFYGDVSGYTSYQDALQVVTKAQSLFGSMSSKVRNKFDNDPAKFIAFMADENNKAEALELGIISKKPEVVEEPVVNPAPVVS